MLQPTELRQSSVIPDSPARPGKYIKNNPKTLLVYYFMVGGVVTSLLEILTPDQVVQVRALAGDLRCVLGHSGSLHPGV